MTETLIRVVSTYFVAGLIARNGRVIKAAPILIWAGVLHMDGKTFASMCRQRWWTWEVLR